MKRILYIELNEDGTVGGSHRIQADLVTRLPSDYQPVVLHYETNSWAESLRESGVEVHLWDSVRARERAAMARGGKIGSALALAGMIRTRARFLRTHRIDLVHLNNSPFQGLDDWLPACRLARVPCATYAMGDARPEPSRLRRTLMRGFDLVLPLSRLVEDSLVDNGLRPDRLILAYPGMDLERISAADPRPAAEVRAEFGVSDDRVLAVMVGNIRPWKGQHVVVEALGHLPDHLRRRLTVLMVGDVGPEYVEYTEGLRSRAAELGVDSDTLKLTGRRTDVPDLLEAGEIAIHATVTPEPFGLVVLEALIHGCAVVAAGAGGPVEMIDTGSGLLHDPEHPEQLAQHLSFLLEDADARRRLATEGRTRARRFDVREHVRIVTEAYRGLLGHP